MTSGKYSCVLFDLDGTLTDSGRGIINGVRYALEKFGIQESDQAKLNEFIGPPLTDSLTHLYGFSEADARKGVVFYREYYGEKGIFENAVYDGIEANLDLLKGAGVRLFVATGKPENYMKRVLEHFNLSRFFEFSAGSDEQETRLKKHEIISYLIKTRSLEKQAAAGSVLMIGDRKHDVIGAKTNKIPCAGALWGYGSAEELTSSGATFLLKTPNDLASLL